MEVRGESTRALLKQGGKLVADYGSYQLVDAPSDAVAALPTAPQVRDEYQSIFLNAGTIDTAAGVGRASRSAAYNGSGNRLHLVQFKGPIQPAWYRSLEATGVRIVTYIPSNAYLVYGDPEQLTSLQQQAVSASEFQWEGAYLDGYKLHPAVHTTDTGAYQIQLVEDPAANADTLALANSMQRSGVALREDRSLGYVNLVVYADRGNILELARRPDVVSVQVYVEPRKRDERQNMIISGHLSGTAPTGPGYLDWLASKGFSQAQFDASNFAVDVSDSGFDNGTPTPNHSNLYRLGDVTGQSRVVYARLEGSPNGGSTVQGCDGHGNLNGHIVGGYNARVGAPHTDAAGFNYGIGVAPFVKLGSSVVFDPGSFTAPDYEDLQSRAWRDSARISTNSWGASANSYTVDAQRYDALVRDAAPTGSAQPLPGNQEMVILFAAGNDGSGANTVGSPGTAKNVITVGASENVQAFGGADACGTTDAEANSAMDIVGFSSRGPTHDGRKKPDLVAPGTHITGGVAQAAGQRAEPPAAPLGSALGCFDASGVCAGPGGSAFFPLGQQWYTGSSGTSHSTPAVAGGAALLRQYFINNAWTPPSPALTKAWLVSSARYLTGVGANDNLFSNSQGMGLMDLGMALDEAGRIYRDQDPADLFTASGQVREFHGSVGDSSKPLRVTLAWTDAPGSTSGNAYRNDLDLAVTVGGNTYLGNVFSGPHSTTGGTADPRNNLESVFLPAGVSGPFTVTVTATNINSDGVPNVGDALDQDFALVIYNACTDAPGVISDLSATLPGDNQVELNWSQNGAGSYRIYRSVAGGPFELLDEVASPPYLDEAVSGGAEYAYVVRGKDCAEAGDSNVATVVATGVCTLPPQFAGLGSVSNSQGSTCTTSLSWAAAAAACGGTISYNVYRSTSPLFEPGVSSLIATGITGTSFADDLLLEYGSTYHYVVRAVETSAATVEEQNTVVRSAAPTGTISVTINYFDDFDSNRPPNASSYFIEQVIRGGDLLSTVSGCHYQSGTTAYKFGAHGVCGGTYAISTDNRLIIGGNGGGGINGFVLAPSSGPTELSFRLWYDFESAYDGAYLQYSTVSATGPWTLVGTLESQTAPYFISGGYSGALTSGRGPAWTGAGTGANGALSLVRVNLAPIAGNTVWFGVFFTTDNLINREGVYIDDIRVFGETYASCTTNTPPPGPAVRFDLGLPATAEAGEEVTTTVTARDVLGQVAVGYTGEAVLSGSDPQMTSEPSLMFSAGTASLTFTARTAGSQSLSLTDTANPGLTGDGALTVTPAAAAELVVQVAPSDTRAGAAISPAVRVAARDVFGNAASFSTPVAVALEGGASGAVLGGTLTRAPVSSVATFSDLTVDKAASGYALAFSADGLTGATSDTFSVEAGDPAALTVLQQPSTLAAGVAMVPAPVVAVLDAFGNQTSTTGEIVLALANPQGAAILSGASAAAVNGIATFSDLRLDRVGSGYMLTASSGALPPVTTAAFDVIPGQPVTAVILEQPGNTVAGAAFDPPVRAALYDAHGNLATQVNVPVTAALFNAGAARLLGDSTVDAVGGVATFSNLAVDKVGAYALVIGATGSQSGVSANFTVSAGAPAALAFTRQPADGTSQQTLANVEVQVTDAWGNPVEAATQVSLAIATGPAGAVLAGDSELSTSAGLASFSNLSLALAGNYTLHASAPGLGEVTSSNFRIGHGAAVGVALLSQPSATTAGVPLAPVRAHLHDAAGNTVTAHSGAFSVALAGQPAGTLRGTTSAEAIGGVATFSGLTVEKAGQGYTLTVSAGALAGLSAAFDVAPAAAQALVFTSQPGNTAAGAALGAITVEAHDAFGNRSTGFTGEVRLFVEGTAPEAALGGAASQAAAGGVATFDDLSVSASGTYALVARTSGLAPAWSDLFDVSPAQAAALRLLGAPASVTKIVPVTLSVRAVDAAGNLAVDFAGEATITSTDAAATLPATVTFASGAATAEVTFRSVGTQTVTITAGELSVAATLVVTAFPQPTVQITSHAPGDEAVRGEVQITVEAKAAAGTTLTAVTVYVDGAPIGTGTTSPFTATWDASAFEKGTTHEITAVVTDSAGNTVSAQPVVVTLIEQSCGCAASGPGQAFALFGLALAMRLVSRRRTARQ